MALTYLTARVADTFADSGNFSFESRLQYLEDWKRALLSGPEPSWVFEDSVGSLSPAEAQLLLSSGDLLQWYRQFRTEIRHHGDEVISTLIEGMKKQVLQTREASSQQPTLCHQTTEEFDQYCFYHAGCVGLYWNRVFDQAPHLEHFAVDYGKALERINVLRDVEEDRMAGRILLPKNELEAFSLCSDEPWKEKGWRSYMEHFFEKTRPLVIHALQYVDSLPRSERRLRFASMIPIKILIETFSLYRGESWRLRRAKIERSKVRSIIRESMWDCLFKREVLKPWRARLDKRKRAQ